MNKRHSPEYGVPVYPIITGWQRVGRLVRNALILFVAVLLMVWFAGVPHVQFDYRYQHHGRAKVKMDADYWSVTGKRVYGYGSDAAARNYPFLIFVPVTEVIDLPATWSNAAARMGLPQWMGG